ncbi:NAD-dependent epimerase/dehydratase family protein [Pseudodesulfovibrio portus]|uniref:UDP-glucose 4-epimerase n=1 Tax=Pseudodesulfovibrio portus TaxID=231439 RepID=A0ABM8ANL3_9BACT|nr:NAD(P)-dependent oxidoreductase [Pseudodesulfovibrio portus]BDQ32983.1 UDP-glucose 4-epimerase [Pseudodesulfovibrio portus]
MAIKKILILGHSGFIGQAMMSDLAANAPGVEAVGLSYPDVDFSKREDWDKVAAHFNEETAVVFLAAVKRQVGDNRESFARNMDMIYHLAEAVENNPVGKLVFYSSTAVYGEDVQHPDITEETGVQPTSFYGLCKFTAERVLLKACDPKRLVCLRPPTAYGGGDLPQYGPSGFTHKSVTGETIVLWGDGEEKREFVYIDDLVAVTRLVIGSDFSGVLNVCAGKSYTFRDVLKCVAGLPTGLPPLDQRERTKDKVDNYFDNTLFRETFPDFAFTPLEEGILKTYEAKRAALSPTS